MGNSDLEIPTDVPWRLASTTRPLGPETLRQDTTTISLFTFVPTMESLDRDYPEERLIYLKFTISVSPMSPLVDDFFPPAGDPLNLFEVDVRPIFRLLFDVRISPEPYGKGAITPYFLAASPVRRSMIESGVVGQLASEGESKSLAIGKSGSQMHEGFSSTMDTSTTSAGASWPLGSASITDTSTTVAGSREVVQHIDSTQREASTERRELVSHMTNVSNVLTLLSLSNVGSPYLRFSLWPRPLRPLTIDPADPNLWYAELLRRRSSGIEGIQEFFAIAVVPRALEGFCINAQLRRFSAVPPPLPTGQDLTKPGSSDQTAAEQALLEDYLHKRFPPGTPADNLDVEVTPYGNPATLRPVVGDWYSYPSAYPGSTTRSGVVAVGLADCSAQVPGEMVQFPAPYKTAMEVWLDMKRDEFEQELLKSPLEAGDVFFKHLTLHTCFGPPISPLVLAKTSSSKSIRPKFLTRQGSKIRQEYSYRANKFRLYQEAVFAWNAVEDQIGSMISHSSELPAADLRFDQPRMIEIALRRLAALAPEDPANKNLKEVASWFKLSPKRIAELQKSGIIDLRGLADTILLVPVADRLNRRRALQAKKDKGRASRPVIPPRAAISLPLSSQEAEEFRHAFGITLQHRAEEVWSAHD
jgi:hypothetical protein